jgi:TetR/AcrR family transcriptional regulator
MKTPPPDLAERLLAASPEVLRIDADPRLEDVARLIGASRATLYYYFSGRDDLLDFLLVAHIKEGAAAIRAAIDPSAAPAVRLRATVDAMLDYLTAHPGMCAGILGALTASGRMATALQANDAHITGPLRELLIEGKATRALAIDSPADAANAVLGGVFMGVLGRALAGQDATDQAFRRALADQIVRGVVDG